MSEYWTARTSGFDPSAAMRFGGGIVSYGERDLGCESVNVRILDTFQDCYCFQHNALQERTT